MALGSNYLGSPYLGQGYAVSGSPNLSGTIVSSSTAVGTLTTNAPLSGTVVSTSSVLGTVTTNAPLSGTVVSSSTVAGTLSFVAYISGTVASSSTVSGTLSIYVYTTFTPPIVADVPPILPDSSSSERRLFRYFPNRNRYVAVYLLSDGTYAQDVATPENSNTNIPIPWNPNELNAPYSEYNYYDYTANAPVSVEIRQNVWIVKKYGDGPQSITPSEGRSLLLAGYGDRLS